jgi:Zn-dependent protease with chaperone function
MSQKYNQVNFHFWLLILICLSFATLSLSLSWTYGQTWIEILWHICLARLQNLPEHLLLAWKLIIPAMLLLMAMRGGVSLIQQLRATARLTQLFFPLREPVPARVRVFLAAHELSVEDVVFLDLPTAHAFCSGFWKPHIWLTAGLVNLLTDEELTAVLAHEAYHCRQHDPLRLLVGRALKSAFFFLPLVGDLAKAAELQQEVAADRAAIFYLGNDLPLLSIIQKLLTSSPAVKLPIAAYSPFNVTEARLRRLIYPLQPFNWRLYLTNGVINLGVIAILSGTVWLSIQPNLPHSSLCIVNESHPTHIIH